MARFRSCFRTEKMIENVPFDTIRKYKTSAATRKRTLNPLVVRKFRTSISNAKYGDVRLPRLRTYRYSNHKITLSNFFFSRSLFLTNDRHSAQKLNTCTYILKIRPINVGCVTFKHSKHTQTTHHPPKKCCLTCFGPE